MICADRSPERRNWGVPLIISGAAGVVTLSAVCGWGLLTGRGPLDRMPGTDRPDGSPPQPVPTASASHCPDRGDANPRPDQMQYCGVSPTPETSSPGAIPTDLSGCGNLNGYAATYSPNADGTVTITNNGPDCVAILRGPDQGGEAGQSLGSVLAGATIAAVCVKFEGTPIIVVQTPEGLGQIGATGIPFVGEGQPVLPPCPAA